MDSFKIQQVYFSPAGTTKKVVEQVTAAFSGEVETLSLLQHPLHTMVQMGASDLLIVGMPVYAGRIPAVCVEQLENLKGSGTPAILLAVYGNREFEDALLELKALLEPNGFTVVAAGAVVAQHSIFPTVAKGRPDEEDIKKLDAFALACVEAVQNVGKRKTEPLQVKGNFPYRAGGGVLLKPAADDSCNGCGACVSICPVQAISKENPRKTDKDVCISCTACISICPQKARQFHGPMYQAASLGFMAKCAQRKEPEWFI